jgi:hypothetical protein
VLGGSAGSVNAGTVNTGTAGVPPAMSAYREQPVGYTLRDSAHSVWQRDIGGRDARGPSERVEYWRRRPKRRLVGALQSQTAIDDAL